jgi:hypothetical protein
MVKELIISEKIILKEIIYLKFIRKTKLKMEVIILIILKEMKIHHLKMIIVDI